MRRRNYLVTVDTVYAAVLQETDVACFTALRAQSRVDRPYEQVYEQVRQPVSVRVYLSRRVRDAMVADTATLSLRRSMFVACGILYRGLADATA